MAGDANGNKRRHVLAVPMPAQSHVMALMKLSRLIASHGVKVTFVNTESIHKQLLQSANPNDGDVVMTYISDGVGAGDDPSHALMPERLRATLGGGNLRELVEKINGKSDDDEKISCIIADISVGWVLDIAEDLGAEAVGFSPASAASLALILRLSDLIEQGTLDQHGTLQGSDILSLSDDIPPWRKDKFNWSVPASLDYQKIFLEFCLIGEKTAKARSNWLLCNACYELESPACDLSPKMLPIGPLLDITNSSANSSKFYDEDTSCLSWLDEKEVGSVIYVSFGSVAMFSQEQMDELALGLELSGRPFLWVMRSKFTNTGSPIEYPEGFVDRVCGGGVGKIVEWAPQERVLSHASVGCFLTHCGWNSVLEGLAAGVPFLCWPYFADHYHNESYICDKWKLGLRIDSDGNGIRSREEFKKKIEMVIGDDDVKANALRIKAMTKESVAKGSSFINFQKFIDHIKE